MDDYGMKVQATVDLPSVKKIDEQIRALEKGISKLKVSGQFDDVALKNLTNQLNTLKVNIGTVNFSSAALTELTSQVEKALNNINISGANIGKQITQNITENIDAGVVNQINKISDSSTSTIVQNEKKKQEAYKATSDAVVYHAGVISKLNKAETNGRFYGSNRGTGYFGTGHYFVDSKTKHELDNNSSYSKLPYTSVDISKYDNLFKATTDEIASKLHSFLENLTKFTQGSDRFNIDELFSQFKNVFTDTTMDIKDFGDKMEQLKSFMSNSNLSDRSDSVSTQFMKSLGYGGVDTRGTKYADTRYGTVIYDLKEESVLQANITDELQKQGQMLEKINYEKGQVFDSSADTKIQEQIDVQRRLAEVQSEFKNSFDRTNLDKSDSELSNAQKRITEIDSIIENCRYEIDHADKSAQNFARDMADLGLDVSDAEIKEWKQDTSTSYQKRIEELSLERTELEKRIPILEENYNKESQLASEAYKQAEQIVDKRRLEAQQSSATANEVIQNEQKKQQAIQNTNNTYKSFSELKIGTGNIDAVFDKDGVLDIEQSLKSIRDTYSEFGKVKITNKLFDPDGSLKQFRVEIQQTNGDLKESRNFMMALSEDGKSFCFPEDAIRGAESFVHHLNDGKKASNDVLTEEQKLANIMGDVREKTELARQAEEQRQQTAQNKVINKTLEDEYKQRQKLADQVNKIQLSIGDKGDVTTQVKTLSDNFIKLGLSADEVKSKMNGVDTELAELKSLLNSGASNSAIITQFDKMQSVLKETQNDLKTTRSEYSLLVTAQQRLNKANTIEAWKQKNSAITKQAQADTQAYIDTLRNLNVQMTKMEFEQISRGFKETEISMRGLNKLGASLKDQFSQAAQSFTQWLSVSSGIMLLISKARNAVTELKDINSILTEISKTADQLSKFDLVKLGMSAFSTAGKYGKKASDYLTGIQEMYRAGYENAEDLAKLSTLVQAAGDMQADLANDYLIATDAAYKLKGNTEALNAVLDGQNYITNRNALSMQDLAEATKIAASQSASSGIAVDKATAAMGTMIATTRQGGDVAARAWKGILMNIQQVEGEVEDGEIIDAESLSKYEKACEALGVSLKEVKDGVISLRDPMQILKELSEAYTALDESDARRANLISAVGGKIYHVMQKCITRMNLIAGNPLEPCTTI